MKVYYMKITAVLFLSIMCATCALAAERIIPTFVLQPDDMFEDPKLRALTWAAGRGNLTQIDELIAEGIDVNASGTNGATPLWWALKRQNTAGFEKLLQFGANPNHLLENGNSVMSHVPILFDTSFLKLALRYGGDPNLLNPRTGSTPVHSLVSNTGSNVESVKLLVEAGADINLRDGSGWPPIIRATAWDRYDIIHALILAGADYRMTTLRGERDVGFHIRQRKAVEAVIPGMPVWRERVINLLAEKGYVIEDN